MATHPQLQLHGWAPSEPSVEHFFSVALSARLQRNFDRCRALGGRFGFRVGDEQWLVDLGWVRVTGGGERAVLEEVDEMDAIVSVSKAELLAVLEGRSASAAMVLDHGSPEALAPLLMILAADS